MFSIVGLNKDTSDYFNNLNIRDTNLKRGKFLDRKCKRPVINDHYSGWSIHVLLRPLKQVLCLDDLNPMFCTVSNKQRSGWAVFSRTNRWVYTLNLFKPLRQDHLCQSQSGRSRNPNRSWQSEGMFGFSIMMAFNCLHCLPSDSG